MGFINRFLDSIVANEEECADHWLLTEVFYPALPKPSHRRMFIDGYEDSATHFAPVYDWWNQYIKENVTNTFLRDALLEAMYDENIRHFIWAINEKFADYITYEE